MGWLFDLALRQGKRKKGKLAEELYSSSGWEGPKYREIRSLENILRKLDKGNLSYLEKWADWFPRLLAAVLDVSEEAIWEEAALVREASERPSGMYWLADLKGVKPLDLARENPFPGLPPEVLTPDKWDAHWWHTRPAEEAEVVAPFLQARRLARVVRAETWSEALERLPNRGAVLVILTDEEEAQSANAEDVPARLSLLVAAYGEAPFHETSEMLAFRRWGERGSTGKAWKECENPDPDEWIEALLRWVHGRLEPDGHFDFDLTLQLTQRAPLRGMFLGPCDLLSFCGLLDETRRSVVETLDVLAILRVWLRLSTTRAKGMDPQLVEFFEDPARGAALVYGLFRNYLFEFGAYGGLPTAQDWASFVPAGLFPPPDYEGARALVSEPGDALHGDKLRRLRDKLGPSHIALIDTLTGLRILRPRERDRFLSHQFWLEELIVSDVIEALPEASPQDLGKALLRNPAYEVVPVLWGRFTKGDVTALERSLEALDPSNVFTVAAFEACVRAYGLAVLYGLEIDEVLASRALRTLLSPLQQLATNASPGPREVPWKSLDRSRGLVPGRDGAGGEAGQANGAPSGPRPMAQHRSPRRAPPDPRFHRQGRLGKRPTRPLGPAGLRPWTPALGTRHTRIPPRFQAPWPGHAPCSDRHRGRREEGRAHTGRHLLVCSSAATQMGRAA